MALYYSNRFNKSTCRSKDRNVHVWCAGLKGLGSNIGNYIFVPRTRACKVLSRSFSCSSSTQMHKSVQEKQLGLTITSSTSPNIATFRDVTRPTKQPGYHVNFRWNPYLYQGATITYFLHIGGHSYRNIYKELEPHSPRSGQDLRDFSLIRSHLDGNASGWSRYCRSTNDMPDLQCVWLAVSEGVSGVAMSLNLGMGACRAI